MYAVRRFDNVRCVSPRIAEAVMKKWTTAAAVEEHPGVVPLYRCFVAQRALFFVHQVPIECFSSVLLLLQPQLMLLLFVPYCFYSTSQEQELFEND